MIICFIEKSLYITIVLVTIFFLRLFLCGVCCLYPHNYSLYFIDRSISLSISFSAPHIFHRLANSRLLQIHLYEDFLAIIFCCQLLPISPDAAYPFPLAFSNTFLSTTGTDLPGCKFLACFQKRHLWSTNTSCSANNSVPLQRNRG
jgi:hypothetical protein